MFEIPRILAHRLKTVLRRSVVDQEPKGEWPILTCRSEGTTLRLFVKKGSVGVSYDHASTCPPGELAFRSTVLSDIEGRSPVPVTLERLKDQRGRARWNDGRLPRFVDFTTVEPTPSQMLADVPTRWQPLEPHFLSSFDEAVQTSAQDNMRFALAKVQLRGRTGEIVSTDGRQLLVQSGFSFPWSDDVLVPKVRAFGIRELGQEGAVSVGRVDKQIFVRVGAWTFFLDVQEGRFPDTRGVIPRAGTETASIEIDNNDARFLLNALPKLPGDAEDFSPVTVDLDGKAIVRARDRVSGETTEIELSRSSFSGKATRFVLDRKLLHRAMRIGCTKVNVFGDNAPFRFDGADRTFVAVPLSPETAIQPSDQSTRVVSSDPVENTAQIPQTKRTPMPPPTSNGHGSNGSHPPSGNGRNGRNGNDQERERMPTLDELVEEAEIIRSQLHDLLGKATRFLGNLKQHRRQSRAVHAAVQSIRDLKLGG